MEELKIDGAAEGYIELFNRYGVDYIFSSPGTEFVPFWEYLAKYNSQGKKPFYINTRHEAVSLTMAKGYAMATGKSQVVLTHVLVGLLHGAMELRALYTDNIPVVLLVGQTWTHDKEIHGGTPGSHYMSFTQIGGQPRVVEPYVKWSSTPTTNVNILDILARAFDIASSDIMGPVVIGISRELIFEKITKMRMPEMKPSPSKIQADPIIIKKLAKLLSEAESPLLYTRYLGRNHEAVSYLVDLADFLSIPVIETPGYMNFPSNHPLHLGYNIFPYIEESDLILVIDSSSWPPWYPPKSIRDISKAKIVFMDLDPLQRKYPSYTYPADMLITADSSLALPVLLEELKELKIDHYDELKKRRKYWTVEHRRLRKLWEKEALEARNCTPIDPRWLCYMINKVLDENTRTVHETITHGVLVSKYIEVNRIKPGNHFQAMGPVVHSGLGQGLGVSLGVKLSDPEKTVIALEGDGSFNYNPVHACFGLSQEYNIPFLTVLFDNESYAAMNQHKVFYPDGYAVREGRFYGVSIPRPDYVKLTETFGGYGELVEDPANIKSAILDALEHTKNGSLALLDVLIK
jgi:acetolactate synthase-1/2/3 large subunit